MLNMVKYLCACKAILSTLNVISLFQRFRLTAAVFSLLVGGVLFSSAQAQSSAVFHNADQELRDIAMHALSDIGVSDQNPRVWISDQGIFNKDGSHFFLIGSISANVNGSVFTYSYIVEQKFEGRDHDIKIIYSDFKILNPDSSKNVPSNISGDPFITGVTDQGIFTPLQAFLYDTETESFQILGGLIDDGFSTGTGVNMDGSVVTGNAETIVEGKSIGHAFRWAPESGMIDLGSIAGPSGFSQAFGVSGDGSTIVGESELPSGIVHAYRWTELDGFEDLGIEGSGRSIATAITSDGEVIVGGSGKAIRWAENTGMVEIGAPNDAEYSLATAVSNNGSVIVGNYDNLRLRMKSDGTAEFSDTSRPFRWTSDGMTDLQELLEQLGVDLAGVTLVSADGVSEDGQFIWGSMLLDDAEFSFDPVSYFVQVCDDFVENCIGDWPAPYNGVTPHVSLNLELNNISALNSQDGLIYSCLNILSNGEQSDFNGVLAYDVAFEILSIEEGTIGVVDTRPFNENMVLNEVGELPDCSGSIDLVTNVYSDTIQAGDEVYSVKFELFDGENLRFQALELDLIGSVP